jgi:hypothetical protein
LDSSLTLACFSYLSAVTTLHVSDYPAADYGAEVLRTDQFLAADGPIIAGAAIALGCQAHLTSNSLADDVMGRYVRKNLDTWGVAHNWPERAHREITPHSTVISSRDGSRTWFPYLPDVLNEMMTVDLGRLISGQLIYIDCYAVIQQASKRAVGAALTQKAPILANLGGSPPPY